MNYEELIKIIVCCLAMTVFVSIPAQFGIIDHIISVKLDKIESHYKGRLQEVLEEMQELMNDEDPDMEKFQKLYEEILKLINGSVPKQDAAVRWQMGFQDPATPVAEGIFDFHHELFYVVVFIVFFVGVLLIRCVQLYDSKKNKIPANFVHQTTVEVVWTLTPAYLLLLIAVPSFALLYSMDECIDPEMTTKALGHQWYWSYEYSDYTTKHGDDFAYDSYMINDDELKKGQLRLLEVDRRVVFPIKTHIRVITTSADVIHSWAVPSLGAKLDACPGRLNQTSLFIKRTGAFFGQCSEICGVNHGFMPISVVGVSLEEYVHWLEKKGEVLFS